MGATHTNRLEVVRDCGHKLPGHGTAESKVKMLEQRHRDHLDELKAKLGPIPRTVELTIAVTSPRKVTFTRRWFTKFVSLVKNTKPPAG